MNVEKLTYRVMSGLPFVDEPGFKKSDLLMIDESTWIFVSGILDPEIMEDILSNNDPLNGGMYKPFELIIKDGDHDT